MVNSSFVQVCENRHKLEAIIKIRYVISDRNVIVSLDKCSMTLRYKKTRLDLEKGEAINLNIQGDFLLT